MKRVVASLAVGAILAVLSPESARAQATQEAPAAAAPAPPAAEKRPEPRATRGSWTRADARACLEFPTNLQIIKCAEKYRYVRVPA
jgi:pyruvate/2-oxoglutarate dehydrogenase complex dihydrolipoamide acyltransferase (E2) component